MKPLRLIIKFVSFRAFWNQESEIEKWLKRNSVHEVEMKRFKQFEVEISAYSFIRLQRTTFNIRFI